MCCKLTSDTDDAVHVRVIPSYLDLIPTYCSISHSEPTLNLEDVKHLPKLAQQKLVLRHVNLVPCDMVASRSDVFSLRALVYSSLTIQQSSLKGSFNKGHFNAFYGFSTCFLHVFQASRMNPLRFWRLLCSNSQ